MMRFDGSTGRKPSAEARRYVYGIVASSMENDVTDPEGWLLGGIEDARDVRRVKRAAQLVIKELRRKQQG